MSIWQLLVTLNAIDIIASPVSIVHSTLCGRFGSYHTTSKYQEAIPLNTTDYKSLHLQINYTFMKICPTKLNDFILDFQQAFDCIIFKRIASRHLKFLNRNLTPTSFGRASCQLYRNWDISAARSLCGVILWNFSKNCYLRILQNDLILTFASLLFKLGI